MLPRKQTGDTLSKGGCWKHCPQPEAAAMPWGSTPPTNHREHTTLGQEPSQTSHISPPSPHKILPPVMELFPPYVPLPLTSDNLRFWLPFTHNLDTCHRSRDLQAPGLQVTAPHHPVHIAPSSFLCSQHLAAVEDPVHQSTLLQLLPSGTSPHLLSQWLHHHAGDQEACPHRRAVAACGLCSWGRRAGVPQPYAPSTSPHPS